MTEQEEFERYRYLAVGAASFAWGYLPRNLLLDWDDYFSVASMGLLYAIRRKKYDDGRFIVYAKRKALGFIQDHIRVVVWQSRRPCPPLQFDYIEDVCFQVSDKMFGAITESPLFPEALKHIDNIEPFEIHELIAPLLKGKSPLNAKEKKVIRLRYFEDLAMLEIGELMDLTEARISQIHKIALGKLERAINR